MLPTLLRTPVFYRMEAHVPCTLLIPDIDLSACLVLEQPNIQAVGTKMKPSFHDRFIFPTALTY